MAKILGLVLVGVGIVLLIYGIRASESFTSEVSRFFTGSPTDRTLWLVVGGIASSVAGIALLLLGSKAKG